VCVSARRACVKISAGMTPWRVICEFIFRSAPYSCQLLPTSVTFRNASNPETDGRILLDKLIDDDKCPGAIYVSCDAIFSCLSIAQSTVTYARTINFVSVGFVDFRRR